MRPFSVKQPLVWISEIFTIHARSVFWAAGRVLNDLLADERKGHYLMVWDMFRGLCLMEHEQHCPQARLTAGYLERNRK